MSLSLMGNASVTSSVVMRHIKSGGHLSASDAKSLYMQYSGVLAKVPLSYSAVRSKTEQFDIFVLSSIGHHKGGVIMTFMLSQDPLPYILFEHKNPNFIVSMESLAKSHAKRESLTIYERNSSDSFGMPLPILQMQLIMAPCSPSYGQFHWVINVQELFL